MRQGQSALRIERLTKQFPRGLWGGTVTVLDQVSLDVAAGEVCGLAGPNGAGKTTLLRIVLGLIRPTAGTAWIFDSPIIDHRARQRVGYLPETPYVHSHLTASESVSYFGQLCGMSGPVLADRVQALLELVGLSAVWDQPLRGFSKGMLQRVGIAQALVNDPDLLLLDEPMSGLDPIGREEMRVMMAQLKQAGKTIVMSTHLLHDVEAVCDRVALFHRGRVAAMVAVQAWDERPDGRIGRVSGRLEALYRQIVGVQEAHIECVR